MRGLSWCVPGSVETARKRLPAFWFRKGRRAPGSRAFARLGVICRYPESPPRLPLEGDAPGELLILAMRPPTDQHDLFLLEHKRLRRYFVRVSGYASIFVPIPW